METMIGNNDVGSAECPASSGAPADQAGIETRTLSPITSAAATNFLGIRTIVDFPLFIGISSRSFDATRTQQVPCRRFTAVQQVRCEGPRRHGIPTRPDFGSAASLTGPGGAPNGMKVRLVGATWSGQLDGKAIVDPLQMNGEIVIAGIVSAAEVCRRRSLGYLSSYHVTPSRTQAEACAYRF
jgi:hypothetical protein